MVAKGTGWPFASVIFPDKGFVCAMAKTENSMATANNVKSFLMFTGFV
jgi:hypothetical protein